MWFKFTYENKSALMFFDGHTRSIYFEDDFGNPSHAEYLAWVEAGNTPEPWEATNGPV